jgi:hypothetical protein
MPAYRLSEPEVATFIVIPVLLAIAFVRAVTHAWERGGAWESSARRVGATTAAATTVWMALTWIAAASRVLQNWDRTPPPFAFVIVGTLIIAVMLAFSEIGTRIARHTPLWVLVGIQGFRLPLEIAMHALVDRGIMPEQMTYTGRNLDVVTGATAFIVAAILKAGYGGRWLVATWNVIGLALLVNVVSVAIASMPLIRYFGNDRVVTFVTYVPFVWLPAVMVLAALAGHLIVFRALAQRQQV